MKIKKICLVTLLSIFTVDAWSFSKAPRCATALATPSDVQEDSVKGKKTVVVVSGEFAEKWLPVFQDFSNSQEMGVVFTLASNKTAHLVTNAANNIVKHKSYGQFFAWLKGCVMYEGCSASQWSSDELTFSVTVDDWYY